jgi:phosphoribosylformylglycinamidine synthase
MALHRAISTGLVRACHDLSEGGLAAAVAEMAFAGRLGARLELDLMPIANDCRDEAARIFSESNTRFVCEVSASRQAAFEETLAGIPNARIGEVVDDAKLLVAHGGRHVIDANISDLKEAWQAPFRW